MPPGGTLVGHLGREPVPGPLQPEIPGLLLARAAVQAGAFSSTQPEDSAIGTWARLPRLDLLRVDGLFASFSRLPERTGLHHSRPEAAALALAASELRAEAVLDLFGKESVLF